MDSRKLLLLKSTLSTCTKKLVHVQLTVDLLLIVAATPNLTHRHPPAAPPQYGRTYLTSAAVLNLVLEVPKVLQSMYSTPASKFRATRVLE